MAGIKQRIKLALDSIKNFLPYFGCLGMMSPQQYSNRMVKLASLVIVPAFFYSRAAITICLAFFVIGGLLSLRKSDLKRFVSNWSYSLLTLIFFMIFISGLNSENVDQWLHHLNIKLPFLLLPFAFYKFDFIDKHWVHNIHYWFVIVLSVVAIPVTINFFLNYDSIMAGIAVGHPMPTPIEHVKYSMMNAYGVISGMMLLYQKRKSFWARNSSWLLLLVIFLFVFQHLIAVRTGLIILYCSLILFLGLWVWKENQYKVGVSIIIGAVIFIMIAINQVPSLKQKVGYMKYDLEQYSKSVGNHYSDSDRLQSWKVGWQIFESSPLLGSGMGDLQDECRRIYKDDLNRSDFFRFPHNQFMYLLAGTGLFGLLLFLIGFYGPLLVNGNYKNLLLMALYLNFTLSFLVENSIERSFSLAFFLFFALLSIQGNSQIKSN